MRASSSARSSRRRWSAGLAFTTPNLPGYRRVNSRAGDVARLPLQLPDGFESDPGAGRFRDTIAEMTEPSTTPRSAARPGGRTALVTERVLVAAMRILSERGVEGLQYEELATRAGVGRATIYRRWPDREDLVHDALARFAERSIPLKTTGDIGEDLVDFVSAVASTWETPEGKAVLRVAMDHGTSAGLRDAGLRLLDERLVDLQDRVDSAVAAGQLPRVDAGFLNQLLVGPVHLFLLRESTPFTRQDAGRIVTVVLAGLRAGSERRSSGG